MSENRQCRTTHRIRRSILDIAQLLLVFLFGFVPTWLKSREWSSRLSEAAHQLSLIRIENSLVPAAVDARSGDYETARLAASGFFYFPTDRVQQSGSVSLNLPGCPPAC